ncbi:YggS family pyridoxal phosphate-dependent enzyme [Lysobacter korlensis]|uniref:Pyridoxal phosphate homeostasis protein n=1 Tax=Lysobacter korlensis TaxID=553636 RepID=A0ABV6RX78_9GAMM
MSELADRLHQVDERIAGAARAAGRDLSDITRIVVTKFQPVSMIRELHGLGVRDFGENRHQEAAEKASEGSGLDLTWHFVGQLQSKKARQALGYARVVHSVDRESLIAALAGEHPVVDCFVQLNLTDDPNRGGVRPDEAPRMAELVAGADGLRLIGVMAVAPLGVDPRRAFARVRETSDRVRAIVPEADRISAGMSGDFWEAVESGATHLRIGTAITGNRPDPA